jgi:hypothetical protein
MVTNGGKMVKEIERKHKTLMTSEIILLIVIIGSIIILISDMSTATLEMYNTLGSKIESKYNSVAYDVGFRTTDELKDCKFINETSKRMICLGFKEVLQ